MIDYDLPGMVAAGKAFIDSLAGSTLGEALNIILYIVIGAVIILAVWGRVHADAGGGATGGGQPQREVGSHRGKN